MANKIITTGKITIPGVAGTAYTTADALGTKIALANIPQQGIIRSISFTDLANQDVALDILFFDADITGGTDHDVFAMVDADAAKFIGHIAIVAGDYSSLSDNSVASQKNIGIAYETKPGTLTLQCVTRGTPTYAASDLVFELSIDI